MCTHAFCMRVHTQSMRTHTAGLCMQAYVCTCILMPRNLNPTRFASVSLFCLHNMLMFCPVFMPISLCLPCLFVVCPSHVRLGFLFLSLIDMP